MSGWRKERDSIRERLVANTLVNVLLVEGKDDTSFFEALLNRVAPGAWESRWAVSHVNGKKNVLEILDNQATWLGIIDRDEWSEHAANAARDQRAGQLLILPRFCMESYFIQPDELWNSLPEAQQAKVIGEQKGLEADVIGTLPEWVCHGALWHVINPLWDGLRSLGFKEALLDRRAAQDDQTIMNTLHEWHAHLNPERIFQEFETNREKANAATRDEQLRGWIHGKVFFREHVVPVLNRHLGPKSADDGMVTLLSTLPVPEDLSFVWRAMQISE